VEIVEVGGGGMSGVGGTTGDIVVVGRGIGLIETGVGEGGTIPTLKKSSKITSTMRKENKEEVSFTTKMNEVTKSTIR
jgi:hypothetical protein